MPIIYVVDGFEVKPKTLPGTVSIPPSGTVDFVRSDANADGAVDLADVTTILAYLFAGGTLPCLAAADVNGSHELNVADPVYLLNYLFAQGPPPPAPFPDCGTPDTSSARALPCERFPPCAGP